MGSVMERVNTGHEVRATGQWKISDFVEKIYLPWCEANKSAPTANGYKRLWNCYLSPHVGNIALANLQTSQVTALLDHHAKNGIGRNTLSHIKFGLSGVYEYAITTGVLPMNANPVRSAVKGQGAKWTIKVARPEKPSEYSLDAVLAMLRILGRCCRVSLLRLLAAGRDSRVAMGRLRRRRIADKADSVAQPGWRNEKRNFR
jgi:hypothetical protein